MVSDPSCDPTWREGYSVGYAECDADASRSIRDYADEIVRLRAQNARLLEACRIMAMLIKKGPDARYTVTPGAALNSFVEAVLDPAIAAAERIGDPK